MSEIFEQYFNGFLTSKKALRVDAVVHKAIIEIDEEGSEAAPVTGENPQPSFFFFQRINSVLGVVC